MYRAKQLGRGRHCFYDAAMRHDSQRRASLEADLHRALAAGQIECHLQPIVRLTQGYPVVGFEALARWRHPMHGLLSPVEFIPLAEESGLILPVDLQILQKACAHMAAWNRAGHTGLHLSVNISGRSLQDPSLVDRVEQILGSTGMMVDNLYLEITETVLVDEIEATGCTLARLNDLGLKLAVDDFGTGYSSLRYLKRFPVAILKIDRSFVDGLGCDREDETIVSAVLGLAGALGIAVVAEGVETAEQAAYLQKQGCGWGQGFQFGRPLPVEQAKLLLPRSAN